jgi:small subunit ribosomal protein S2
MAKLPTIEEMLKAGMHFGHKTSNWHPKMAEYIFGEKGGVHIFDLRITEKQIAAAYDKIKDVVAAGEEVLVVATKPQAKALAKEAAAKAGISYVTERWVGGLLTNYKTVGRLAQKLVDLRKQKEAGDLEKYTKKEQIELSREMDRLEKIVGGIVNMKSLPKLVVFLDIRHDKTALAEAMTCKIETVGVCDSNVNPNKVSLAIPANDDAVNSLQMLMDVIVAAVEEGRKNVKKADAPKKAKA